MRDFLKSRLQKDFFMLCYWLKGLENLCYERRSFRKRGNDSPKNFITQSAFYFWRA